MGKQRRRFSREFKVEAVRLATEGGKPLARVARELGVRADLLREWKRQVTARPGAPATDVFPGAGQLASSDEELRRLRRENEGLRQEHEFLKKAAAYFAKASR
jgi:transposase